MKTAPTESPLSTLAEAFKTSSVYWGERADWLIVLTRHRDSDALTRSNFRTLLRLLGGTGTEGEKGTEEIKPGVAIEEASHWAVGWVQYLIIEPTNTAALAIAQEATEKIEGYPVLNEDDFSALESEERDQAWDDFARREWFRWFEEQCEENGLDEAETALLVAHESTALFLQRAYDSRCMDSGEAGSGPCRDETLETAWRASECGWWNHDEQLTRLAAMLGLPLHNHKTA